MSYSITWDDIKHVKLALEAINSGIQFFKNIGSLTGFTYGGRETASFIDKYNGDNKSKIAYLSNIIEVKDTKNETTIFRKPELIINENEKLINIRVVVT